MIADAERDDQLRRALRASSGDAELDELLHASLYAGTVHNEHDRKIWREETAPEQIEVDLHLTGTSVQGHATRADRLGAFIRSISDATKEVAKHTTGADRWHNSILVEGATPGSVRVVLRAPDPGPSRGSADLATMFPSETEDSRALRRVAGILALASEDPLDGDDPLVASVQALSPQARQRLSTVAKTISTADWELDGHIRRRGESEEKIQVTRGGARHLRDALKAQLIEPQDVEVDGTLDGFRHSEGVVYIKRSNGKSMAFYVADTDAELFVRVKEMALTVDMPVRVMGEERQMIADDGKPSRVTRWLRAIEDLSGAAEGEQTDVLEALDDYHPPRT